ncbi:MAG TPA: hypothetical protein VID72_11260 [Ktedonobacterales bacterium]
MADTKSSAKSPSTGATPRQPTAGPSLGQRVLGFILPPASSSGGGAGLRRKTSSTTRFIIGSVTFILVAELLTYLIDFANLQFKLNLNRPILAGSATWFSWFFVINVVIILGLWILLNRMGFFPRDMWAPRNGATARGSSANGAGGANGNKKSADQIPGIGATRTRAERRYAATAAAEAAAAKAAKGKGRTAKVETQPANDAAFNSDHDEVYDRAKAAQRLRMRRARR